MLRRLLAFVTRSLVGSLIPTGTAEQNDPRICIQCGHRYDEHDTRYFRDCMLKRS